MTPVLTVSDLRKSFPLPAHDGAASSGRLEVLSGVSFQLAAGERLAIMGRSGGGKSTLLSCLSGLDRADSGRIEILQADLSALAGAELNGFRARSIGIVFQQFQLLEHFTALENVRLPLDLRAMDPREADRIAREKLQRVGLGERTEHFPQQLSRGECQRVAIARVLAMGCPLVLADEPTGSLDAATGSAVMDLLFESLREAKASLVLVTHDANLAARCDRRLALQDGRVKEVLA